MNVANLAAALVKIVPPSILAEVLNCTLTADEDERLSDFETEFVQDFHNAVCDFCPEAVDIATGVRRD